MAESDRLESKSKSGQNFYIWELNPQTKQILFSANAEGVHGFAVGSNLESVLATIHPDDLARLIDKIHRAQEGLEPLQEEVRHIHPVTGEIIWLRIEGQLLYSNGASTRLIGVAHNITGQKRAQESLQLSEEQQLRAFFENVGVGMTQADSNKSFLRVNDRYCQITGYSREELLNMTPFDLDHPDEREVDRERLRRFFEGTGQEYNVEKRYVRKDGRVIWVNVTVTLMRDAAGNPLQTAAVIEDITRRKEAEEQIRQQNAVLDGINRIFREALTCQTEDEIRQVCLQVAQEVTGSKFGFINEVNARGLPDSIIISGQGYDDCKIEDEFGHRLRPANMKIHGIYGRVIIDGKPVLTNDPGSHPDSIGLPPGYPPITAFLGVPLKDQGKTIGMVAVGNREGGYHSEDQAALEALSEPMIQVLMRWRANKQMAEDYAAMTRLHEVSMEFDDNMDTLFDAVLEAAVAITRADCGTLQLLDQETGELCLLAVRNMDKRILDSFGKVSAESGTSCAEALQRKHRVIVENYQTDKRFAHTESARIHLSAGIQAAQSTPLNSRTGRLIGMFTTHWCKPHQPADRVLRLIDLLARQAAELIERKQAENELKESEERLRTVVENSRDGINMLDLATGRYVLMSPTQVELTGFTAEEINNISAEEAYDRIHPEDREISVAQQKRVAAGLDTPGSVEYRWQVKSGEYRWLSDSRKLVRDAKGRPVALVGVSRDITERKRREANLAFLAEMSEDFSRLATEAEIMQAVGSRLGKYLNIKSCDFSEVDETMDTATVHCFWNTGDQPDLTGVHKLSALLSGEFMQAVRDGEAVFICNTQTDPRTDAECHAAYNIYAYITVPFLKAGELKYLFTVNDATPRSWREDEIELIREVTSRVFPRLERARAEAALRESEQQQRELVAALEMERERLTTVIDSLPVGVWISDERGQLIGKNKQADRIWAGNAPLLEGIDEYPEYAAWDANSGKRLIPEDYPMTKTLLTGQKAGPVELRICRFDGSEGTVLVSTVPIHNRQHQLVGAVGINVDITERKQVEEVMRESEERYRALAEDLQLADRRKDEFIGMLSHEIRNPLTSIKLGMTMLNRSAPGSVQAAKMEDIIDRQINQLTHLIDDLLDVTRITRNKIALQKGQLELNDLVRKTVQDHQALFQQKGVQLEIASAPVNLCLEADAARLAQVVGNLLHNASKFTPGGGCVEVSLSKDEDRQLAVLNIKDNGMGIEPELLSSIFVPFLQADTSLDRGQSGLGLGLALVKGLVELHGGEVTAHSDGEGKGSEFTIRLPLSDQITAQAPEAIPTIPGYSRRILVIEDIIDVAYMIKSFLEKEGHEVMVAHNGRQGIALARSFQPEVLLCDIGLPGMDGYEVARIFCTDEELKQVYLVSLTGYARPEDLKRAREAGFHCQLTKPVDLTILKQTLANQSLKCL